MYTCTTDRYCSTAEIFETVEDFIAMCEIVFGTSPVLLVSPAGVVIEIPSGEIVLREVGA